MKKELFPHINQYCKQHQLIPHGSKIIVGLSGGPDSVFLLYALNSIKDAYNMSLVAAHLNHEWREEAEKDAQFCQALAQKLGIQFESQKISELNLLLKFNGSKEEIGRKARRAFFEKIKTKYEAQAIALGHHAQDQQETFFIRLVRGASLSGLCAMKPKDGDYIRPLLKINKADILAYLQINDIDYLTDPSNVSDAYLRNRIRKKVLPALEEVDARFNQNFENTLDRLQETEEFLTQLTIQTFNTITQSEAETIKIDIEQLLSLQPIMPYRVILHWLISHKVKFPLSQSFLDELIRFLLSTESKEHQLHQNWRIIKKRNWALISLSI